VTRLVRRAAASLSGTAASVAVLAAAAVTAGVALFGLGLAGALGLYFVLWWMSLFAVLPFGVRSQAEAGEVTRGSDPGAPVAPALNEKAIWTTIVAGIVFVAAAWLMPLAGL
jgi:predicted secreted protein